VEQLTVWSGACGDGEGGRFVHVLEQLAKLPRTAPHAAVSSAASAEVSALVDVEQQLVAKEPLMVVVPMMLSSRMEELRRPLPLFLGILGTVPESRVGRAAALHLPARAHVRAPRPGPRTAKLSGPANVHFPHLN
jgi:acetamidase/formamidase